MALSANTAWEIRPTNGSDTNGGGFVAGATGTDWSQQNAAQYSVTDGVTAGTTTITSATANFGTDVVGNIMYVSGGTGSVTADWYQITARTNSTTITVDRSTGLTAGTGVTLHIGGALKTVPTVIPIYIAGNKIFIKAEAAITTTAGFTFATGATPTASQPFTRIIGYTSTRTDGGKVTITASTTSATKWLRATGGGISFENLIVNCSSLTTSTGIGLDGNTCRIINCKVQNATTAGISSSVGNSMIIRTEVTGCTSAATAGINSTVPLDNLVYCYVHDNSCPGIITTGGGNGATLLCCLITNNTGTSSDGVQINGMTVCLNNTIYGSGRDGLRVTVSTRGNQVCIKNNILATNGVSAAGYGLNFSAGAGNPADLLWDGNAYWNNATGARNNADDTSTNPINGVSAYTNTLDITASGDPFTNAAGGDFTLNNTAGAGAAIRGHGVPGSMPGVSQVGYTDMGVFQHQDSGGGGGGGGGGSRIQTGM